MVLAAAAGGRPLVHVCRDDARMARLADALRFFAPSLEILSFPAWDCLPYDRVSPHRDIIARRIETLTTLAKGGFQGILLTTVNAITQRVPPAEAFDGRALLVQAGDEAPQERINAFFAANGYQRVDTVGEPGEYAWRGGILDVFPPAEEEPLRLDFFGDEVESLRHFDPLSQRSTGEAARLALLPVNEVFLDEGGIETFRSGYRALFGALRDEDPLYESISAGRPHPGMEHWLPLFYERSAPLLDYLPDAAVSLDPQADEARAARWETIEDFYQARQQLLGREDTGGWTYKPLPPERLYLDDAAWRAMLVPRAVVDFHPYELPEGTLGAVSLGAKPPRDFADARAEKDEGALYRALKAAIHEEQAAGRRVAVAAYSDGARDRLGHMLQEAGVGEFAPVAFWREAEKLPKATVALTTLNLEGGFSFDGVALLSEQDILGERIARAQAKRKRPENFLREVSSLEEGDYVVHVDHGIGRYLGLETLTVDRAAHDCLHVVYHGGDKLYVPVENIEVLSRYGGGDSEVELDRLGQTGWQARKARVKERLKEAAEELIRVAAERELRQVAPLSAPEGLFEEFCARFPYPETDDQLRAIDEVLGDLASGRPMDRLICGDVGFGKTEVALRAAFVSVMDGYQVAVVVPTTLLARQHYQTFKQRFAGLPVRIRQLSRLVSTKDASETKQEMAGGQAEIVIGTHALLSKSLKFSNLGLLIVDEEQHFGVKQKERLKELRAEVHVLTLTATPIPRTLQLAMSGVKEMSLIATPPVDRLAVRTFVMPYDPVIVREAILREHYRGGQTFYVCPRIEDLAGLEDRLKALVPEVKIGVAHGRLAPTQLEDVMTSFVDRRFDVLLSTNIVESGLDIPTANTIIIHRADMFGLAQLYQLRGRIGRSKQRGYAYLTLPPGRLLSATAEKRLHVMQTLDTLGAGFTLASHDMDIRGAGNLLGEEQSGHIREVGIELYQQMLEEAVAAARGRQTEEAEARETWTPTINLGTSVLIPEVYVPDLSVRLGLYRRLSTLVDRQEIETFAAELIDRFGPLPEEVENLLEIIAIKRLCRDAGVEKVDAGPKGAVIAFRGDSFENPEGLVRFIQNEAGQVTLRPDHRLVYRRNWETAQQRFSGARRLLETLAKLVQREAA